MDSLMTRLRAHPGEEIVLCIGTDRSTGDCLGPLVGTRLKQLGGSRIKVYGTLDEPVHALNLTSVMEEIGTRHRDPFIIAVDACLGKTERIGYINVKEGVLFPGTALKKSLPAVGDVHVSGVVNVGGFMEHIVLQNTRLNLVYKMAETIAWGLFEI
jgi:putative sporulation protein YyaC